MSDAIMKSAWIKVWSATLSTALESSFRWCRTCAEHRYHQYKTIEHAQCSHDASGAKLHTRMMLCHILYICPAHPCEGVWLVEAIIDVFLNAVNISLCSMLRMSNRMHAKPNDPDL